MRYFSLSVILLLGVGVGFILNGWILDALWRISNLYYNEFISFIVSLSGENGLNIIWPAGVRLVIPPSLPTYSLALNGDYGDYGGGWLYSLGLKR